MTMDTVQERVEFQTIDRIERVADIVRVHGATDHQNRLSAIAQNLAAVSREVAQDRESGRLMHGWSQVHADYARELAALIEEQVESGETA